MLRNEEQTKIEVNGRSMMELRYPIYDEDDLIGLIRLECLEEVVVLHGTLFEPTKKHINIIKTDCDYLWDEVVKKQLGYQDIEIWCVTPKPKFARLLTRNRLQPYHGPSHFAIPHGHTVMTAYREE
jgi:hypothetical protein